mgnify:CR=1 FL=1
MSGTTKAQLQQAQKLLKAKKYDQARRLLVTIDHPTARKWLEKLDKIAPVKPLGSRNVIGWLRDHRLVAAIIGGVIVLVLGMLVIVPMFTGSSEKCDEEMVRTWWHEQEDTLTLFDGKIERARSSMGDNLAELTIEIQQIRDIFAAAPVPECADARVFGNYEQILNSMDAIFVIIADFQEGELYPMEYDEQLRITRSEITNGARAIRDVLDITFD